MMRGLACGKAFAIISLLLFAISILPLAHSLPKNAVKKTKTADQNLESLYNKVNLHLEACEPNEALSILYNLDKKNKTDVSREKIKHALTLRNLIEKVNDDLNRRKYEDANKRLKKLHKVCNKSRTILTMFLDTLMKLQLYDEFIMTVSGINKNTIIGNENLMDLIVKSYSKLGHLRTVLALLNLKKKFDLENKKLADQYKELHYVNTSITKLRQCYDHLSQSSTDANKKECIKHLSNFDSNILKKQYFERHGLYASETLYYSLACLINGANAQQNARISCKKALDLIRDDKGASSESIAYLADLYVTYANTLIEFKKYQEALEILQDARRDFPTDSRVKPLITKCKQFIRKMPEDDYYSILGVQKDATIDQIKSAYKTLARKHHPDKKPEGIEREDAMEQMAKINRAKDTLIDPQKRAEYDDSKNQQAFFDNRGGFGSSGFYNMAGPNRIIIHESRGPYSHGEQQYYIRYNSGDSFSNPFAAIFDNFIVGTHFV